MFLKIKNLILFSLPALLLVAFTVYAQVDTGLDAAQATGLSSTDPRIVIANVIRVILGFLGIIAVVIIMYAGWIVLSGGKTAEQIDKAKTILRNAIIGLILILSSFAIASFVLGRLQTATGGEVVTQRDVGGGGISGLPGAGQACQTDLGDYACSAGQCGVGLECNSNCVCVLSSGPGFGEVCGDDINMCAEQNCSNDLLCESSDENCECVSAPLIAWVSPLNENNAPYGRAGDIITIGGKYFGDNEGAVYFTGDDGWIKASLAGDVNQQCAESDWSDRQILAVVPSGTIGGPIRVVDIENRDDATNNDRGVQIPDFTLSDTQRPSVCAVDPNKGYVGDSVDVFGVNFVNESEAYFGNTEDKKSLNDQDNSQVGLNKISGSVPDLAEGSTGIFVQTGDSVSNSIGFSVRVDLSVRPVIDYISPESGAIGQYITIYGSNFESYNNSKSKVEFYNESNPDDKILADVSFPAVCQNNWWNNDYIIVKVPTVDLGDLKLSLMNASGLTSNEVDFLAESGNPGPGLCLISPQSGKIGNSITGYGDNFGSSQGSDGRFVFFGNKNGGIQEWSEQVIKTTVPNDALTGLISVVSNSGKISNSLPFLVGACTSDSTCPGESICCSSGGQQGVCRSSEGECSDEPGMCAFGWTFSTGSSVAPALTCRGWDNANACMAAGACPNSPGLCGTLSNSVVGSGCGDAHCNSNFNQCSGACSYSLQLNLCVKNSGSCDLTRTDILSGYTATCATVSGASVWQIDSGGVSCPSGSYLDTNKRCTVGAIGRPSPCSSCSDGFVCKNNGDSNVCVVNNLVCPRDSTCNLSSNQCELNNAICECCCRVEQSDQDCCLGTTCTAGGCGLGAPDYGLCTGCRVELDGDSSVITDAERTASNAACNCTGTTNKYCDLKGSNTQFGACLSRPEKKQCGGPCDNDGDCKDGLFCTDSKCSEWKDKYFCSNGGGGAICKLNSAPACLVGLQSCQEDLSCLSKDAGDCRCCCTPGTQNSAGLICLENQSPCTGGERGLFCGCTADKECSISGVSACGNDTCCHGRPSVESVVPSDGATGICRNAMVKVLFSEEMNGASVKDNIIVIGDFGTAQCPTGSNLIKILGSPFVSGKNYCIISGSLSVIDVINDETKKTEARFIPNNALGISTKYYILIKEDDNISDDKNIGVLSKQGLGIYSNKVVNIDSKMSAIESYNFTTGSDVCKINSAAVDPAFYLFTGYPENNEFVARVFANDGQELVSINNVYSWEWSWSIANTDIAEFDNYVVNQSSQTVKSKNVKDDRTILTARAMETFGGSDTYDSFADLRVFLCANPWPSRNNTNWPWFDTTSNCQSGTGLCIDHNIEMYYCRDDGGVGNNDDLPAILNKPVVIGSSTIVNINKEILFLREKLPNAVVLSGQIQPSGGKIYLSWSSIPNAVGYKIYYGKSSGVYDKIIEVGNVTVGSFVDNLENEQNYYFVVAAYYSTGAESGYSNEVLLTPTDTTPPSPLTYTSAAYDAEGADDLSVIPVTGIITDPDNSANHVYYQKDSNSPAFGEFTTIDTSQTYVLKGRFKSIGTDRSRLYFGFAPYDENKRLISVEEVTRYGNDEVIGSFNSTSITVVDNMSGWNDYNTMAYQRSLGFYYNGDTTKLPDYVFKYIPSSFYSRESATGAYKSGVNGGKIIILNTVLPSDVASKIIPGTTVVKNHSSGGTYLYSAASGVYLTNEWREFSGQVTGEGFGNNPNMFRQGTKYVKIIMLLNHRGGSGDVTINSEVIFDDISFTPPGISASAVDSSTIKLSWNKSESAVKYKIDYGLEQGVYGASSMVGDVSVVDVGNLVSDTVYYFKITAFDEYDNKSTPVYANARTTQ